MTIDFEQYRSSRTIFLETFGCQMNELDSELIRGHLGALGFRFSPEIDDAGIILYNTCSVREQAENKVLSRIGQVGLMKQEGRDVILGVVGCMAERIGSSLLKRYPQVDLLCGPGELDKLPMLLKNVMTAQSVDRTDRIALQGNVSRRSSTLSAAQDNLELLDLSRAFDPNGAPAGGKSAYVRITRGCNKYCSYCVVPNTRGPEIHRAPDVIVEECLKLADQGVIEITLLGQTVNHYQYDHGAAVRVSGPSQPQIGPGSSAYRKEPNQQRDLQHITRFSDLLQRIHDEIPAIRRLRFVTSYPRDFGDDILQVMAACPRICRFLHIPAQSGSNTVLQRMNRGYSVEEYVDLVDRARAILPDVCIAGDFIVGFPGESENDFQQSCDLLRQVRYKNSFIFKYSPRPGTVADNRLPDDVPEEVKRRRNNDLLAIQAEISAQVHAGYLDRDVEVFVEQISQHSERVVKKIELGWESGQESAVQMSGRTEGDLIVVFDLPVGMEPQELLGQIVQIRVQSTGPLILRGRYIGICL